MFHRFFSILAFASLAHCALATDPPQYYYPPPTPAGTVVVYQPAPSPLPPQYLPVPGSEPAGYSPYAQPQHVAPTSPSSQSGSGWFMIGFFGIAFLIYVAIGCWMNRKHDGLQGMAAFPHIEFWRRVPVYVVDGCSFSRRWLEGSYRRGAPLALSEVSATSEYEPINSGGFKVSMSRSSTAAAHDEDAALDDDDYARSLDAPAGGPPGNRYDPISTV